MDKAGQKFWNDSWIGTELPAAADPEDMRLGNTVNRRFHSWFTSAFDGEDTRGRNLLEIGCAKSAWLPYFAQRFGFKVSGIDYSPVGAQMARDILRSRNIEGQIVCTDLFSPPLEMLGAFDVVVSFGVAEHFDDTVAYVRAAASYLRPGGMLITSIPNMVGWIGALQRIMNRPVYDIHQLIDPEMLKSAHRAADLDVAQCDYFVSTNFGVVNLTGTSIRSPAGFTKKVVVALLARVSMLTWLLEESSGGFAARRAASPYINCLARKQPVALTV